MFRAGPDSIVTNLPGGLIELDEAEDCVPVELSVDAFRAELRTPGAMTGIDAAYLALDFAGLL